MSNISIVNLSAYTSPVIQENKKNEQDNSVTGSIE